MIMVAAFNSMYQLTVTFPSLRLVNPAKPPRNTPRRNTEHASRDLVARQCRDSVFFYRSCCRREGRDIIESLGPALSVKLQPACARKRNPCGSQLRPLRNPSRRLAPLEMRRRRPRKRSSAIARTSQAHRQRSSHHAPRIQHDHRGSQRPSSQRRHAQAPKPTLRKHLKFSAAPRVSGYVAFVLSLVAPASCRLFGFVVSACHSGAAKNLNCRSLASCTI